MVQVFGRAPWPSHRRLGGAERWGMALLAVTLCIAVAAPASASPKLTWFGLEQDMRVYGSFGSGDRWGKDGNQFMISFDGGMFGKSSPLGNLAGIEFLCLLGYDGVPYKPQDQLLGEFGCLFDLSEGFPVTLLHWFRGGSPQLLVGFAPGMGLSMVSAYKYLTGKVVFRVTPSVGVEGQWTWWPGAASTPMGDTGASVNAAMLRATAYLQRSRQGAFMAHVELYEGQREQEPGTGGNASKVLFGGKDPFGSTQRSAYEDFLRFGGAYAF